VREQQRVRGREIGSRLVVSPERRQSAAERDQRLHCVAHVRLPRRRDQRFRFAENLRRALCIAAREPGLAERKQHANPVRMMLRIRRARDRERGLQRIDRRREIAEVELTASDSAQCFDDARMVRRQARTIDRKRFPERADRGRGIAGNAQRFGKIGEREADALGVRAERRTADVDGFAQQRDRFGRVAAVAHDEREALQSVRRFRMTFAEHVLPERERGARFPLGAVEVVVRLRDFGEQIVKRRIVRGGRAIGFAIDRERLVAERLRLGIPALIARKAGDPVEAVGDGRMARAEERTAHVQRRGEIALGAGEVAARPCELRALLERRRDGRMFVAVQRALLLQAVGKERVRLVVT
jgi:hypothetical protein